MEFMKKPSYIQICKMFSLMAASLAMVGLVATASHAQINPFSAAYYQNPYLLNPAFAGAEKGLNASVGYRQHWNLIPGSPVGQYLTGSYQLADRMGVGLHVYNEEAGVINQTRAMLTYGYHLPLNQDQTSQLHFGLSVGAQHSRIDADRVKGDENDLLVDQFNNRQMYFDTDFGVAFTSKKLTVQAAIPNMRGFMEDTEKDAINRATFFAAASYKLPLVPSENVVLEPKLIYRGSKGYKDLWDAGANLSFYQDKFNVFALYHSAKNATLGAGVKIKEFLTVTGMYTTTPSSIENYVYGNFEFGLRFQHLGKAK